MTAFDQQTFLPVKSLSFAGSPGQAHVLIRWGQNGLAFATDGGEITLLEWNPRQPWQWSGRTVYVSGQQLEVNLGGIARNEPPVADAGGEYTSFEGTALRLDGSGSNDDRDPATLTYEWDLDYDGTTFDVDLTGIQPTANFSDDVAPRTLALRVTDADGLSDVATASLAVLNADPLINRFDIASDALTAQLRVEAGDRGAADTHQVIVDWGDGTAPDAIELAATGGVIDVRTAHLYAEPGNYTVEVSIQDDDGGQAVARQTVVMTEAPVVELRDGVLEIRGTAGDDTVLVAPAGDGQLRVYASFLPAGEPYRSFASGQVRAFHARLFGGRDVATLRAGVSLPAVLEGGSGDDRLTVAEAASMLFGGAGNDVLTGGRRADVLLGGDGEDYLFGNDGRDLVIGGTGIDHLGGSDDIIVDGTTAFDADQDALAAIAAEWNADRSRLTRINNLRNGTGSRHRLNGPVFLQPGTTVWDDGAADVLNAAPRRNWLP